MHRALDSPIGLPSSSMSASWMLAFVMPAEVRRSFMLPPESLLQARTPLTDPYAIQTVDPRQTHRRGPAPSGWRGPRLQLKPRAGGLGAPVRAVGARPPGPN